ncbi:MAG TPA: hypothetical protein DCG57_02675 [Candidatus Riflebacteria bacterium]|nr:hypothetical protein [Candidatus Riflebacteria bacterium]
MKNTSLLSPQHNEQGQLKQRYTKMNSKLLSSNFCILFCSTIHNEA